MESEDKLTGIETTTLANVNGMYPATTSSDQRDNGMEEVNASRLVICVFDYIASLFFLGMVVLRIRWKIFPSDYAVKVTNIDKNYKGDLEKDLSRILDSKFGRVHEVAVIKDTGDILHYQMELLKVAERIGDLKAKHEVCGVSSTSLINKLSNKESKLNEALSGLKKSLHKQHNNLVPVKEAYVIFEKPINKNQALSLPKGRLELSQGIF